MSSLIEELHRLNEYWIQKQEQRISSFTQFASEFKDDSWYAPLIEDMKNVLQATKEKHKEFIKRQIVEIVKEMKALKDEGEWNNELGLRDDLEELCVKYFLDD